MFVPLSLFLEQASSQSGCGLGSEMTPVVVVKLCFAGVRWSR